MPALSLTAMRCRSASRYRPWMLVLLACLGLLLQPCMTASAFDLASCPHHGQGMPDMADAPCHVVSALDCGSSGVLHVDDSPPPVLPVAAGDSYPDTLAGQAAGPAACVPHGGTDPPVRIRFCSLHN